MNLDVFESLSPEEALDYLRGFLDTERAAAEGMKVAAEESGVPMDSSLASLPGFLKWVLKDVRIVRVPVPASEPDWIREAHKDGLIEFEEESKYLILRAAYYLGECFVRSYPSLRWTTGNPEYLEKNMPVVAGFQSGAEMAPMMIVENMFSSIVGDGGAATQIDTAVTAWANDARCSV